MKPWPAICGAAAILCLLSISAFAQDDPEEVYTKLHRAALAGNSDAVLSFATARQKAELASKSKEEKDAVIQMMAKLMPRTYSITSAVIAPDGNSAVLRGSGTGEFMGKSQLYLLANFMKEAGAWKVDRWQWTGDKPPAGVAQAAPAAKPAAPKPKPVARVRAPISAPSDPAPRFGTAKPDCVYKPVMTNADMQACGIATR